VKLHRPGIYVISRSSGAVCERGSGAFQVDDRVWAYEYSNPKGGFYAEYVAVNAEHVATGGGRCRGDRSDGATGSTPLWHSPVAPRSNGVSTL